jgi:hypothetical protein
MTFHIFFIFHFMKVDNKNSYLFIFPSLAIISRLDMMMWLLGVLLK